MGNSCCGSEWRAGYAAGEKIQRIRPQYNSDYLHNPHKGTATYQRFEGDQIAPDLLWHDHAGPVEFSDPKFPAHGPLLNDRYPRTTVSYCRWPWSVLEPEQGKMRFDFIEKSLEAAAKRGQTLQIRTQPLCRATDYPQWHIEHGGKLISESTYGVDIDCNTPAYLEHFGNHIRLLGERFDGHPSLETVNITTGGYWGEGGGNVTPERAAQLVDIYVKSFEKTPLMSLLGTHGCKYAATLCNPNIGWRADCIGDMRMDGRGQVPDGLNWNHMYDLYPMEIWKCGVVDAWKSAPVTWETCWTVAHWANEKWDIDWIIDQALKYHPSFFMPKSVYVPESCMDKIMEFVKRMGYRFFLQQMILPLEGRPGQVVEMQACIDNKGVAPIYRHYHLALRFSQGKEHHIVRLKQDIRKWMPDLTWFMESFTVPPGLLDGETEVSCAIVDDKNTPRVKLAIKSLSADGWHPLTHMDVVK